MSFFKEIRRKLDEKILQKANRPKIKWRHLFSGELLTTKWVQQQIPFVIFIVVLVLVHIQNRFAAEEELIRLDLLKKELVESKCESYRISGILVEKTRSSYLIDKLKEQNSLVQESLTPVTVIEK